MLLVYKVSSDMLTTLPTKYAFHGIVGKVGPEGATNIYIYIYMYIYILYRKLQVQLPRYRMYICMYTLTWLVLQSFPLGLAV